MTKQCSCGAAMTHRQLEDGMVAFGCRGPFCDQRISAVVEEITEDGVGEPDMTPSPTRHEGVSGSTAANMLRAERRALGLE